ncbi:MAG: hypothetical protein PHR53_05320, partial [Bacteroidales bacterium]|nr:hypothetical protein [Bacteroidales bacterium]
HKMLKHLRYRKMSCVWNPENAIPSPFNSKKKRIKPVSNYFGQHRIDPRKLLKKRLLLIKTANRA